MADHTFPISEFKLVPGKPCMMSSEYDLLKTSFSSHKLLVGRGFSGCSSNDDLGYTTKFDERYDLIDQNNEYRLFFENGIMEKLEYLPGFTRFQ